MSLWRIRITISDDPRSLELFTEALADQPASLVRLAPRGARGTSAEAGTDAGGPDMAGEVVVELAHDEGLATLLGALHGISPQVFVSRAEPDEMAARRPPRPARHRTRRPTGFGGLRGPAAQS